MDTTPELPAAYNLVEVERADCLKAEAARLARSGAEEGTLLWLKNQIRGKGRLDSRWYSQDGDLHCSIIMYPDFPRHNIGELFLVASVAMGNALGTHLSPMTALGYQWPNRITIAGQTVAAIWIEYTDTTPKWITLSASVNILSAPEDFSIPAISILEAEGSTELNRTLLLETWARQFITLINIWSERGMPHIVDTWKIRAGTLNQTISAKPHDAVISGEIVKIYENGDLELITDDNHNQRLALNDFMNCVDTVI